MVIFGDTCPGGWLCIPWQWVADDMYETAFYGALALPVLAWMIARLFARRRRKQEEVS